ncbi:MAG: hypothetical protein Q9224_000585, partial [Gallowayella concinna]
MNLQLRRHTVCILCRLLLDRNIILDHNVLPLIQDIVSAIVDSIEDDEDEEDPGLQLQLLRNLPSSSSRQSLFRRRLALAFFFRDPAPLSKQREDLSDLEAITRHLGESHFIVNTETDYSALAASIATLAIGLDDGDPPPMDASTEAIATFNNDLDRLALRIKAMFTQIVDTGASHMKRTEAKE